MASLAEDQGFPSLLILYYWFFYSFKFCNLSIFQIVLDLLLKVAHIISRLILIDYYFRLIYRIRRCPVPPVSFVKFYSLATFWTKFYFENFSIRNYFKKVLFIFFIWYDTAVIKQSSSYFFGKVFLSVCFFKLSMKLAKEISSSSTSFTSDHIKSIAFSSLLRYVFAQ